MRLSVGRDSLIISAIAALSMILPISAVTLVGLVDGPEVAADITRDLAAVAGINPVYGALSSLGAFLWFASGTLLLFVACTTMDRAKRQDVAFLMFGSLLSFYLWFDDFFMFHEELARKYLGLHDNAIYVVLAVLTVSYLFFFRLQILRTRFLWLGAALGLLGLSVAADVIVDAVTDDPSYWTYVVEDVLKWAGIVCWATYHIGAAFTFARTRSFGHGATRAAAAPTSVAAVLQEIRQRWEHAA